MKLLSVIATIDPTSGGPAQGIRNNILLWKNHGIVPSVLSFDAPNVYSIDNFDVFCMGPSKTPWAYTAKAMSWFLDNLSNYDAVLVHGLWLYNGYSVTRAIKQLKRLGKKAPKIFIMPHGMLDPYFQEAPERKLKAIRNIIYWHLIEKHVVNNSDGILFTCEEEMRLASSTFSGYNPISVHNVGYGIKPPPAFTDTQTNAFYGKCSAIEGKPYFLFLSRIHQKKGVDILLRAYVSIYQEFEKKGIVIPDLVIAGPGIETDYGHSLKALEVEYPILAKKVHYPGMLHGDAKWGAVYGAKLFILPSHQENFGIAIVEAMACKIPVLITKRVNIWQEIQNGAGGLIVDDNLESLNDGLKTWLIMDIENKVKMGIKAYETYVLHFTAESTSKRFVGAINR